MEVLVGGLNVGDGNEHALIVERLGEIVHGARMRKTKIIG
jgi:hypothetical protein